MIDLLRDSIIPLDEPAKRRPDLRCAAVLMPIVDDPVSGWQVILTRRAEHLKHHPGQISFPGGGFEANDKSLAVTAVRETHEEIGIGDEHIELIGRLPQQETISQYFVTPFVGLVDQGYQLSIDQNEVAEVFKVPLAFVTDQTNQIKKTATFNGKPVDYYVIQYEQYTIWGATARILVNLTRRMQNR
ncbi:CoA pyrophosphatase [Aliikangiella marina]|uniref:CoA pyrophosphatase n=1 Tax=Aliikangiella marina TaxID=1712262 RepID=A0A545TIK5_9GAMM|nr:CoA pyrophosphatase [Aliikangiella marina]TQV77064.1 CoA pyrophosphatase [Aliikangiella marina]